MGIFDKIGKRDSSGGFIGALTRFTLRFFQFVLALTVAGLYGVDLDRARKAHVGADGKWVFAEIVAGLSAVTCLLYGALLFLPSWKLFAWDWVLFILWTALFGLFGSIFIPADPTPHQPGQIRMKHAVWVDLACMLLWLISAAYATIVFMRARKGGRTLHTGRAKV